MTSCPQPGNAVCWVVSRSTYYHRPKGPTALDLQLMKLIDRQYLKTPFYGSRKIAELLSRVLERPINRKRVQRLMRLMGIEAIYQKTNASALYSADCRRRGAFFCFNCTAMDHLRQSNLLA